MEAEELQVKVRQTGLSGKVQGEKDIRLSFTPRKDRMRCGKERERERRGHLERNSRAHDDWRVDQYREMTEGGGDSPPAWV